MSIKVAEEIYMAKEMGNTDEVFQLNKVGMCNRSWNTQVEERREKEFATGKESGPFKKDQVFNKAL